MGLAGSSHLLGVLCTPPVLVGSVVHSFRFLPLAAATAFIVVHAYVCVEGLLGYDQTVIVECGNLKIRWVPMH